MVNLQNCLHCGGKNIQIRGKSRYYVMCRRCGMRTRAVPVLVDTEDGRRQAYNQAVNLWNAKAQEDTNG